LLSLAGIGGIYLLGFVVVLLNIYIYRIFSNKKHPSKEKSRQTILLLAVLFIISSFFYLYQNKDHYEKKINIAVITTSLPSMFLENGDIFLNHIASIKNILAEIKIGDEVNGTKTDIIVLPEDTRFTANLNSTEKKFLQEKILEDETLLIDSGLVIEDKKDIKSALVYSSNEKGDAYYNKTFLAPYGEYLPYIAMTTARLFGQKQLVDDFNASRGYVNGNNLSSAVVQFNDVGIGTLFCSEIVPNKLYRTLTKNGASVLINVASHAVFNGSKNIYKQTLKMAKVHAVSNNRYFIQSTNFAPSFVLNNKGEVISKASSSKYGIIYSDTAIIETNSTYNKVGDWILFFAIIVCILCTSKKYINYPQKK